MNTLGIIGVILIIVGAALFLPTVYQYEHITGSELSLVGIGGGIMAIIGIVLGLLAALCS